MSARRPCWKRWRIANAIEQTFKDVKEVWGAQQQQLRNVYACIGAFNVNLWCTAWWKHGPGPPTKRNGRPKRQPLGQEPRRPSHADKRKALQREVLQGKSRRFAGRPTKWDSARCLSVSAIGCVNAPTRRNHDDETPDSTLSIGIDLTGLPGKYKSW